MLVPMVGYQGGKRRYGALIASSILARSPSRVYDLGVGSGAVTLALLGKGFDPALITAVDAGPWGDVWAAMGAGTFDVQHLTALLHTAHDRAPIDVKRWVEEELSVLPCTPEVFVVMQAASFGASPVWHDGTRWRRGDGDRGYCARAHWTPGPGSKETKPRGTIFAHTKIIAAAEATAAVSRGLDGRRARMEEIEFAPGSVVYIDPPYDGAGGYGYAMDWPSVVARHRPTLISEARPLDGATTVLELDLRKGGSLRGISRERPCCGSTG